MWVFFFSFSFFLWIFRFLLHFEFEFNALEILFGKRISRDQLKPKICCVHVRLFFVLQTKRMKLHWKWKDKGKTKHFFHYAREEEYSMFTVSLVLNWNCSPELLTGWQTPANSDKQQCREFNLNGQRCLWNCTHISAFNSQLIFIWRLFLSHTRTVKPHNACQSHVYTKILKIQFCARCRQISKKSIENYWTHRIVNIFTESQMKNTTNITHFKWKQMKFTTYNVVAR